MNRTPFRLAVAALLYGAISLTANAVAGGPAPEFTTAEVESLKALREGDMVKLVIHDKPRPRIEAAYRDLYGNRITLADHEGKVVLLNFWATWCPPCVKEMPALDDLAGEMDGDDFKVIALSTDRAGAEHVAQFYEDYLIENLEVMHDRGGAMGRQAGVLGLPVTLVLDRHGREIGRMLGDADWSSPEAKRLLKRVIELTRKPAGTTRA